MDPEDITPQILEQLMREGIDLVCKLLWGASSPAVQEKYPRYHEGLSELNTMIEEGVDVRERFSIRLALDIFGRFSGTLEEQLAIEGLWLEEVSLFACRLGCTASIGDVEYFFRQRLDHQRRELLELRDSAKASSPPDWAKGVVKRSLKRYQSFKSINLDNNTNLTYIMEREAKLCGGDKKLTLKERVAVYLQQKIASEEHDMREIENILSELQQGNPKLAMLWLGQEFEIALTAFQELVWGKNKDEQQSPVLAYKSKGQFRINDEVLDSGCLLYESLLKVLQPVVGRS